MKTTEIRDKLHQLIDTAGDKKVKVMYAFFEENAEEDEEYTPEFKAELDRRYEAYKKDGKTISRKDMEANCKLIK